MNWNPCDRLWLGILIFGSIGWLLPPNAPGEEATWHAGLARVDVTPEEPVRMSGYGNRDHASEGIDTPLHARCLALRHGGTEGTPALLISVDNIGLPGSMTRELAQSIQQRHGVEREKIAFCSTHTHCGPDLLAQLSNIFAQPLSDDEVAAGERYKTRLSEGILRSVELAIQDLQPAALSYASGEVGFAANRRVLTNGRWSGFGVQPDGPVDHAVPILRVEAPDGKVRGVVFNYACHCTTLGGDHYQINGDWAGYATTHLEANYPGAVALCTIGCGADANPNPRGSLDVTKVHGRTLAAEVARVLEGPMTKIGSSLRPRFDYAALTFDLPTQEELQQRAEDSNPQTRRHAERMLDVLKEHGRLPATYPVPIQSWQFGNELTMIFLGGEVVVDYALRLKQQLDQPDLWVTAYANDVMGYVASERMIAEGGYEYDRSGIYYGLPGPWATGTEDLLVSRILEMLKSRGRSKPLSADQAIETMEVSDGFTLELVAAEPLVEDPINLAFDAEGRMWVVEMGGYPEKETGGRVKTLTDTDGDGRFDTAVEFLTDLSYPTGVIPWKDGVLVSAAPDVFMARDTDGDGKADDLQTLYTGFRLANPQHRINGFTYGLDHSLHLASGDNLGELTSLVTGTKVNASGHDVQIWPDRGELAVTSGRTQYVRSRNDWGEWFGNDNSRPMFHFPIDDTYLKRNPAVRYGGSNQPLFDPPVAPPVFPLTSATERFNDLFAANRFTSACSSIVARVPGYSADITGEPDVAFICEPVHNLVHRAVMQPAGASYRAERSTQESSREFLRSTDPWFRPVRAVVGPDGFLYIVDMYRETIEHPEWIPESWQAQLDLYAGSDRGRIYRVRPRDTEADNPRLAEMSTPQLIEQLRSPIGPRRDLAQQLILENDDASLVDLSSLAKSDASPVARAHALSILDVMDLLEADVLASALRSDHVGLLLVAIPLSESRLDSHPELLDSLAKTARHDDLRVVMRTALALGQTDASGAGEILAEIAAREHSDPWLVRAISSSAQPHAEVVLDRLMPTIVSGQHHIPAELITNLLITARRKGTDIAARYGGVFSAEDGEFATQLKLAGSFSEALQSDDSRQVAELFRPLYSRAIEQAKDSQQDEQTRCASLRLVGIGIESAEKERTLLLDLLSPNSPVSVQQAAIDRMAEFADSEAVRDLLEKKWPSMSKSVRDHCIGRMLERQAWADQLLHALENETIRVTDLSPAARQQLTHTGTRSMRVRAQRLTRQGSSLEKRELIQSYLAEMNGPADAARGADVFKQHCAVCHVANAEGQAIGASLDNLTDRSHEALLTAILDPNRAVDPKYHSYAIRTEDDRLLVGAIEDEAGPSLTLAHADGKRTTILREDIAEMKNTGVSLMPEGLQAVLPAETMRDLLNYLQTMTTSN